MIFSKFWTAFLKPWTSQIKGMCQICDVLAAIKIGKYPPPRPWEGMEYIVYYFSVDFIYSIFSMGEREKSAFWATVSPLEHV